MGASESLLFVLTRSDPIINHILIGSPYTANPKSRDLFLREIFTDCDLVEFQVAGQFFGGYDVGHRQNLPGKKSTMAIQAGN